MGQFITTNLSANEILNGFIESESFNQELREIKESIKINIYPELSKNFDFGSEDDIEIFKNELNRIADNNAIYNNKIDDDRFIEILKQIHFESVN
jgi:hypothetical protein